jgi:hypothetical protein
MERVTGIDPPALGRERQPERRTEVAQHQPDQAVYRWASPAFILDRI